MDLKNLSNNIITYCCDVSKSDKVKESYEIQEKLRSFFEGLQASNLNSHHYSLFVKDERLSWLQLFFDPQKSLPHVLYHKIPEYNIDNLDSVYKNFESSILPSSNPFIQEAVAGKFFRNSILEVCLTLSCMQGHTNHQKLHSLLKSYMYVYYTLNQLDT
jgi:hypothetical protein